jgi:hypothetical protein
MPHSVMCGPVTSSVSSTGAPGLTSTALRGARGEGGRGRAVHAHRREARRPPAQLTCVLARQQQRGPAGWALAWQRAWLCSRGRVQHGEATVLLPARLRAPVCVLGGHTACLFMPSLMMRGHTGWPAALATSALPTWHGTGRQGTGKEEFARLNTQTRGRGMQQHPPAVWCGHYSPPETPPQ